MTTIVGTIGTTYTGSGGTAIAATVGDWTRELIIEDTGTIDWDPKWSAHSLPIGAMPQAVSRPQAVTRQFIVQSTTAVSAVGTDAREKAALTEWLALGAMFKPYTGLQYLTVARGEGAGTRTSVCLGEVISMPGARVGAVGVGQGWLTGNLRYPVTFACPFPYWWLAADPTDSVAKCGAKFIIAVTGSVTRLKFANSTTGGEFSVDVSDAFADDDYIDFCHADKLRTLSPLRGIASATAKFVENGSSEAKIDFWLAPGNNSITVTRVAGTGTAVVTVKNQPLYASI